MPIPQRFLFLTLTFAALLAGAARAVPAADGLYATFDTTQGVYTLELFFEEVPVTVANFVGLAEGSRAWVDFETGEVSNEPFYDGLKIPRAEPGFVIQMGSPDNSLSGGPGYQFGDEFHPALAHFGVGVASMANSGADTNGSQLFITLASTRFLDDKHSVFGVVVEGLNVVQAIGALPGGTVTINKVTITRVGTAAEAFDPAGWGLPVVAASPVDLDVSGAPAAYLLKYTPKPFTEFYAFQSGNLSDWAPSTVRFLGSAPPADFDVTGVSAGQSRHFFKMTEVRYVPVPASVNGLTLDLTFTSSSPNQILTLGVTAEPRASNDYENPLGTHLLTPTGSGDLSGRIGAYVWTPQLHRGVMGIVLENLGTLFFNFKFRADGSGTFTGYASGGNSNGPFPYFGTFTSTTTP